MKPYYEHAGITIYHGDCREVLPSLSGVDMVFTSPPYNMGHTTCGGFCACKSSRWMAAMESGGLINGYGTHDDNMPHDEYVNWQKEILTLLWNVLNDAGAIYYNHKTRIFDQVACTPLEYNPGLPLRQIVIWARSGGMNFNTCFYVSTHEWICIFAKANFRLASQAISGAGDTWYIPQESNPLHPAPFPLELPKRAISTTTSELVLDPFCGIGTTLRAAKDLHRRAIGIEIEERYCEIAAKRMEQEVFQFTD